MMIRFCMMCLLALGLLLGGCGGQQEKQQTAVPTLVLYSELENKFTADLVAAFNAEHKDSLQLAAIAELKANSKPDLVLAELRTLSGLERQGRLQAATCAAGDRLPEKFRDSERCWYGIFYDPAVLLINQRYVRTIGQNKLRSWSDLENNEQVRIAMENLSDSNSTSNFLAGFAEHYGETTSLNYLWNINRFVSQYAKFPFTPIRMTAAGDADLAITRQSYVFKYLESKFPAYVVQPQEGTPVNLYCMGLFKESQQQEQAELVMEWLLSSPQVQTIAQEDATGYQFLFPRGLEAASVDGERLWLHGSYLAPARQEQLTHKWLEKVRFSK